MQTQQSSQPVYQQIKAYITEKIRTGAWYTGTKIPTEAALVKHFATSRMTVNRAVRELAAQGLLVRKQGRGTFVAEQKQQAAFLEIFSITDDVEAADSSYSWDVQLLCEEKASPELAQIMDVEPYTTLFHSIVVHKKNTIPFQLGDRYINPALAPHYLEQDFTRLSPAEYLLQIAPDYTAEHVLEAMIPKAWVRDLLCSNASEPCLALTRKTWIAQQIMTYSNFYYPGSRFRFSGTFSSSAAEKKGR